MFMSTLDFKVTDLDFPVGSKNKTAARITAETDAFLIDTGLAPASGRGHGQSRGAEPALRAPRRPIPAPVPAG
jgi:hypothetical protein